MGDPSATRLGVWDACAQILADVSVLPSRRAAVLDALGHVLAEDISAPMDLPAWDNSGMDGFAVRNADVQGARADAPRQLRVIDDVPAGRTPTRAVEPGTAIRVMTGAPVPAGAEAVIRVEHTDGGTDWSTAEPTVRVFSDSDAHRNIRKQGEELRKGETVLTAGTLLRAAEIGVATSFGRTQLTVVRRPRVAVLTCGDELVGPEDFGAVLGGHKIVSSNTYCLAMQLAEAGMDAEVLGIANDSEESLREHVARAAGCDALITSAGISMGEHDLMRSVLRGFGLEERFWRVRIRPGSPFAFGRIGALGGIPWFGLPGNPVSTMVTFEVFVRPALLRMAGHAAVFPRTVQARLGEAISAQPGMTHFLRVRLHAGPDGEEIATPTGPQGSGMLTSMAAADALMVLPEERTRLEVGDPVRVMPLGAPRLAREPGF
jgi:molybdopterin molybdotransferase